ncbi:hypothetical protein FQN54_001998 [Arachnomyces sp. PD_36]|nr:hypothetical protein FQN54_001998 [Arachnomyces sp. PD_36]
MPGVPSGKACEACRKQKKKCDETKPSCSRCARLNIPCIGSGQQRFKFKEELGFQPNAKKGRNAGSKSGSRSPPEKALTPIPASPSSGTDLLASAWVGAIKGATDLRYNLGWSYGAYLYDIPQRLGRNEALDISVDTLATAHSTFCSQGLVSVEGITKYSRALSVLRTYLNDPIKARTPETLCAVSLLLICQNFLGQPDLRFSGHAEGAVQILKARRHMTPQDDFEERILLSLRGPVLFEGLFNDRIQLSAQEWKDLIESALDKSTSEGHMMRCLARLPVIMRRGRNTFEGDPVRIELRDELRIQYETTKLIVEELGQRWGTLGPLDDNPPSIALRLHSHYQRMYALGLLVGIIINCVLSAFDTDNCETLMIDSTYYAAEILALAPEATRYRPIGASYMALCLMGAWAGTDDGDLRTLIEIALNDYRSDFRGGMIPEGHLGNQLEQITDQMRSLTVEVSP